MDPISSLLGLIAGAVGLEGGVGAVKGAVEGVIEATEESLKVFINVFYHVAMLGKEPNSMIELLSHRKFLDPKKPEDYDKIKIFMLYNATSSATFELAYKLALSSLVAAMAIYYPYYTIKRAAQRAWKRASDWWKG